MTDRLIRFPHLLSLSIKVRGEKELLASIKEGQRSEVARLIRRKGKKP